MIQYRADNVIMTQKTFNFFLLGGLMTETITNGRNFIKSTRMIFNKYKICKFYCGKCITGLSYQTIKLPYSAFQ